MHHYVWSMVVIWLSGNNGWAHTQMMTVFTPMMADSRARASKREREVCLKLLLVQLQFAHQHFIHSSAVFFVYFILFSIARAAATAAVAVIFASICHSARAVGLCKLLYIFFFYVCWIVVVSSALSATAANDAVAGWFSFCLHCLQCGVIKNIHIIYVVCCGVLYFCRVVHGHCVVLHVHVHELRMPIDFPIHPEKRVAIAKSLRPHWCSVLIRKIGLAYETLVSRH